MAVPTNPKIYHIVHVDRLASILTAGGLLSDAQVVASGIAGTTIGMSTIKQRRLNELRLSSHPGLYVGQCVPFYFCPRSVMLYLIYMANDLDLAYRGGQDPIIHFQADLNATVAWANSFRRRWAFSLSNAGSRFFEDRCDLGKLDEIDWDAVSATNWRGCKDGKQAEFLLEGGFPWELVEYVGVKSQLTYHSVISALSAAAHRPRVEIRPDWYY